VSCYLWMRGNHFGSRFVVARLKAEIQGLTWSGCRGAELAGLRHGILTHGVLKSTGTPFQPRQQVHIFELAMNSLHLFIFVNSCYVSWEARREVSIPGTTRRGGAVT